MENNVSVAAVRDVFTTVASYATAHAGFPVVLEWLRERGSGFTVVDDAGPSLAELQAERERLKERLAQVERMIAERSGDGTDEG